MKKSKQSHVKNTKSGSSKGDWHVSHTSMGMGDYYGTGVKQKVAKIRDSYMPMTIPVKPKSLKKPPKSLA